MTAVKKRAKKKASKPAKATKPTVITMTIYADNSFSPNPLELKAGELLKIVRPGTDAVDITVSIDVDGGGGSGGPVTIHS
jgi:hypothetical protein